MYAYGSYQPEHLFSSLFNAMGKVQKNVLQEQAARGAIKL